LGLVLDLKSLRRFFELTKLEYHLCTAVNYLGTITKVLDTLNFPGSLWKNPAIPVENESKARRRILLLIPHLGGGGAEKVFALLAHGLSREKYDLHLGIVTSAGPCADEFSPDVSIHVLGAPRVRSAAFRLLALVRRLKPQVIVSGMFHLNFLVLLLRPFFPRSTRVLVRQNGTLSASLSHDGLPVYTRLLYRLLYRHADRILCQSEAMAADLASELAIPLNLLAVLPNPLDIDAIRRAAALSTNKWPGPGPHLLAAGRLSKEKGFDLLLEAFRSVQESFPAAQLLILGTGPEEAALQAKRRQLGLEQAVHLAGHVNHPCDYFPGASLFVLSSRHEGMPNALLEAAAGGLPIVALPASDGVRDLLRDRPGAWVAQDISAQALAVSLLQALAAIEPGQRFPHPFIEAFRIGPAIRAYEELIDAVLRGPRP
jgi:glycosyltransferase involved in cell wall biosynthesis